MKCKSVRSQFRAAAVAPALVVSCSHAAEVVVPASQRVFVCAHSFMLFTAKLLPPTAEAAGIAHINAGQQMIGGFRIIQHWNLPDAANGAKTALRKDKVDVLTLSPHTLLPDPGVDHFTRLGLEKNPALRVLVQASWATHDGTSDRTFANKTRNTVTVASLRAQRDAHNSVWLADLEVQVRKVNDAVGRQSKFAFGGRLDIRTLANATSRMIDFRILYPNIASRVQSTDSS